MLHCIDVIKHKKPKIFVLENVKNFKNIQNGEVFNFLMDKLRSINNKMYNVYFDILNTKNYGIPQNRERIYIIGIRKDSQIKDYTTPKHKKMKDLNEFLIDHNIYDNTIPNQVKYIYTNNKHKVKKGLQFLSTGQFGTLMNNITPTLTCSHPHYIYNYKRYLYAKECLLLQGFPKSFKQVVSDTTLKKQAGNSMSINVLQVLFKKFFLITI